MDMFHENYICTLGTKISKKQILIKKPDISFTLIFSIWDVLGKDSFRNICKMAFEGAKGAIVVCDHTKMDTLQNISKWITQINNVAGEIPIIILANKSDLTGDYEFTKSELESYSGEQNLPYFVASAKSGDNVIKTFYQIGSLIIDNIFSGSNSVNSGPSGKSVGTTC
jgi:small GTP-binding protein